MKEKGRILPIAIIFLGFMLMPIPYSTAQSANNPPVAEEDAYLTYLNTDLIVTSPGVLANDSDQDNDPLTAILEDDDLEHGTLIQFNSDGSFTYRPDTGFSGVDTLTYRVSDNTDTGNEARIYITVSPNSPPGNPVDVLDETIVSLEVLAYEEKITYQHAKALITKLESATASLDKDKLGPAINQLEAFINQVNALINSENIDLVVGQELIDGVQSIIDILQAI